MEKEKLSATDTLPVLPLRDVVVYPYMVIPLFVGRTRSIKALEATKNKNLILVVGQKSSSVESPGEDDIYDVGTIAKVLQLLKLSDDSFKVLVEGIARARITKFIDDDPYQTAETELLSVPEASEQVTALARTVVKLFERYAKLNGKIPKGLSTLSSELSEEPDRLADTIASHIISSVAEKQKLLAELCVDERFTALIRLLEKEIGLLEVERKIHGRIKSQMEKSQREYYLNEQMKAIQNELGQSEMSPVNEHEELAKRIKKARMPKAVKQRATTELGKLKLMPPMSAEATVVRGYVDWLLSVPWHKRSRLSRDLKCAEEVLDADHYGLKRTKEHIVEYLAVQHRIKKVRGPILCLVGPPGVGKTSLGKSIARATNRSFVRFSLGGVRDEAEIRGHRRTYIGSLPGRIIQGLVKAGKKNPLFLLDEVDKMSMDFRGDPGSALLEVLDPEQNHAYNDHYLEVDCDLSEVMFITTANSLNIPPPLLDRMEILRLSGYTEEEKVNIAKNYLIPKQKEQNGLKEKEIAFSESSIREIIRYYTKEAGVRSLERNIARICRKSLKQIIKKDNTTGCIKISPRNLEKYIGVKRYRFGSTTGEDRIGQVTGLAWTESGGDLLTIEVAMIPGKGKTTYTGQLGDVMQESIEAAMTVVRSRSDVLGIDRTFYRKNDFHIHVPEGATPKDGPSAGVAMCVALVSALTGNPVLSSVAMTGEITLRGEILPIGGLKEKLLASLRGGIKTVLVPKQNENELKEIPKNILADLEVITVGWIDEVFDRAMQKKLLPLQGEKKRGRPEKDDPTMREKAFDPTTVRPH